MQRKFGAFIADSFFHSSSADFFSEAERKPGAVWSSDPLCVDHQLSRKESISSIEGYRATRDTFSFVAVGKDGTSRQRVTERGLE